jgi:SagB-type dehydrogenase family enzyme
VAKAYKTNYWLEAYPSAHEDDKANLVLEDFYQKKTFTLSHPAFFDVLTFCSEFKTEGQIKSYIVGTLGFTTDDAEQIIAELTKRNLLVSRANKAYKLEQSSAFWHKHDWGVALDFFVATQDYPFLDYATEEGLTQDDEMMRTNLRTDPVPPVYKEYEHAKTIQLSTDRKAFDTVDIWDVLTDTPAKTSTKPLSMATISNIMFFTFGQTGIIESEVAGEFVLKTSPSGGARHPTEAYFVSLDTQIPKGVYHYSVKRHALAHLDVNVDSLKLPGFEGAKAIIILSAMLTRPMWRYRNPRCYRVALHDLGHLLQTLNLVCKASHIAVQFDDCASQGGSDQLVESALGLDSSTESVFSMVVLS